MLHPLELAAEPFKAQGLKLERLLLEQCIKGEQIAGYVDEGSTSFVYEVDGQPDLLMRLPYVDPQYGTEEVIRYVQSLSRGIGHVGLEQMVAFSLTRPAIVVSQRAGNKGIEELLTNGVISQIGVKHYAQLLKVFQKMQTLGLSIDDTPDHFRLDNNYNFTIIDYLQQEERPQTLTEKVLIFSEPNTLIGHAVEYGGKLPPQSAKYRRAVKSAFGQEGAKTLEAYWSNLGFSIPGSWKLF